MTKEELISQITSTINANGNQDITGTKLQEVLVSIVDTLYSAIDEAIIDASPEDFTELILQSLGTRVDATMSQKAITDALTDLNYGINAIPVFARIERTGAESVSLVNSSTALPGEIVYVTNEHPYFSEGFYWKASDNNYYTWFGDAHLYKVDLNTPVRYNKLFECAEDGKQYVIVAGSTTAKPNLVMLGTDSGSAVVENNDIPKFNGMIKSVPSIISAVAPTYEGIYFSEGDYTFVAKLGTDYYASWDTSHFYKDGPGVIESRLFEYNKQLYMYDGKALNLLSNAPKMEGYTYIGTATPSTTPVTLTGDNKVFYIAVEEGDYSNFGCGNVSELSVIKSDNGSWKVEELGVPFNLFESVLKSSQTCYTTDSDAGIMPNFNSSTGESSVISTPSSDYWSVIIDFNKPITIHSALSVATFNSVPKVGSEDLRYFRPVGSTITLSPEENENYILIAIESKFKSIIVETENLDNRVTNIEKSLASYTNLAPDLRNGFYRLENSGTLVPASSNSYKTIQIDVNSGDAYLYKAILAERSDIAAVCFTNENSDIIAPLYRGNATGKGNIVSGIVKVPEGATKIAFTTAINGTNPILAKIGELLDVQEELNDLHNSFNTFTPILDVIDVKSKNLYPGEYIDRALISTGGGIGYADGYATTELIPIEPSHYYYLSGRAKNTTTSIRCVDAEGKSLKVLAAATGKEYDSYYYMPNATATGAVLNGQFKTPANAVAVQFIIKGPNTNSETFNNVMLEDVGVEYDPTFEPSPYEPYKLKAHIKEDALPEEVIENITGQNKRKAPRILLIGSSHGMNTISQVPWMFYRNGYDNVYIGNVYLGSFMIQELAQRITLGQTLSYQAFKDGAWGKDRGSLTMNDLLNKEWDVIILQRSAATCKQWGVAESTSFGYVVDYITKYVKDNELKTPRILFNSGFADGKANTAEQIMTTALQCKEEYGVEIIPNAYAMANARNTWLKEIGTTGYLCYDNQHLDYGIGCWVASACVYEAVMRPLGESVECVSAYGTLAEQSVFTSSAIESTYTEPTEETMRIAKDCVLAAFNENALNEELQSKYQFKNRVYVFPGWASIEGADVDTKCVADNGSYNITFAIWNGAYFDDSVDSPVTVKMGDTDITDIAYTQNEDNRGGSINIGNITDDVYIIIRTTRNPINPPA